jgi:hypothetical protein
MCELEKVNVKKFRNERGKTEKSKNYIRIYEYIIFFHFLMHYAFLQYLDITAIIDNSQQLVYVANQGKFFQKMYGTMCFCIIYLGQRKSVVKNCQYCRYFLGLTVFFNTVCFTDFGKLNLLRLA